LAANPIECGPVAPEGSKEIELEIAHVLFIDIVGYSKLSANEQHARIGELNEVVRLSEQFRKAEAANRILKIPSGDGMALVFYKSPEEPAQCAFEISRALKDNPRLPVRMGIHSGPVSGVVDVNERTNVAGGGINMAQRVMDCGDAGHILISHHVAEDLEQFERWRPFLHDIGTFEVKHGVGVNVTNLYSDEVGNSKLPTKLQAVRKHRAQVRWAEIAAALLVLALIIGAGLFFLRRPSQLASAVADKSIAVLPLENLTDEKENAYFADGVQDELLSNLAKIKDLKVISRTSVMQYKAGITRNLKEIAQQLGVSNVVEGSVRRSGNHIRVSVQLIDALTDRHIWAQNYNRELADSLALQGELATVIAAEVGATLSPQEKARVAATPTHNTAAYDAYLRGRTFMAGMQSNRSNVEAAIRSYEEAVKLDPGFTLAWTFLSFAESLEFWTGTDPTPARLAAAKEAVDRAVALDPNLPETHLALGYYRYYGLRDFHGALAEFQTAEQGLPNNVDVIKAIGLVHRRMGHWEEAIAMLRHALELDPRNMDAASHLALTYMIVRRFADAIAMADHILALEPSNSEANSLKADSLWAMGNVEAVESLVSNPGTSLELRAQQSFFKRRYPEAADILSKAQDNGPRNARRMRHFSDLGLIQQRAGNAAASKAAYQQAAQELTRELSEAASDASPTAELHSTLGVANAGLGDAAAAITEGRKGMAMQPSSEDRLEGPIREEQMAQIYALLGNADEAIPILKRWIQTPSATDITPALLRLNPIWDPIRNDPRFQALCQEKQS
jgi:TolB-like protein/class 3 adenylate cyclase/Tfp pilus assembly protein PilF